MGFHDEEPLAAALLGPLAAFHLANDGRVEPDAAADGEEPTGRPRDLTLTYPHLVDDLAEGQTILLADGVVAIFKEQVLSPLTSRRVTHAA